MTPSNSFKWAWCLVKINILVMFTAVKSRSISGAIDWNDREVMANQLRGATRPPFEGN